jgi:Tol biopolymer transport system component
MAASAMRRNETSIVTWSTALVLLFAGCTSTERTTVTPSPDATTETPADSSAPPEPADLDLFHYLDLRTEETRPLPENIDGDWSLLSPDGGMFLYGRDGSIYVANVDGSNERHVPTEGVGASIGGWSPDGSMIVYETLAQGTRSGNVFTVDLGTGETTQLTDLGKVNAWTDLTNMEPAFAPDGQTVFFHRPRPTAHVWDIWSVPVTGGEPAIVRRNAGWGRYSPDGRTFAFLSEYEFGGRIFVADAAGGPARELVEGIQNGPPIWSPDGTRIAYVGNGVSIVVVATGETSFVTGCGGPVEWFDDHTLILGPGGC